MTGVAHTTRQHKKEVFQDHVMDQYPDHKPLWDTTCLASPKSAGGCLVRLDGGRSIWGGASQSMGGPRRGRPLAEADGEVDGSGIHPRALGGLSRTFSTEEGGKQGNPSQTLSV